MSKTCNRARWSFSLRAMLVLLALLSGVASWAGVQLTWISERRQMLPEASAKMDEARKRNPRADSLFGMVLLTMLSPDYRTPKAPLAIRIFGEEGIPFILVDTEDREWVAKARRLFPESGIVNLKDDEGPMNRDSILKTADPAAKP